MNSDHVNLITAFSAGIASFANPCIIALIPTYVAMVFGKKHVLRKTLAFSAGFLILFVLLGVFFEFFSFFFRSRMYDTIQYVVIVLLGVVFIFFSFFERYVLSFESWIQQRLMPVQQWVQRILEQAKTSQATATPSQSKKDSQHTPFQLFIKNIRALVGEDFGVLGMVTAFLVGILASITWSPCIGPILSTIMVMASNQAQVGLAFWLFAFYGAGLLVPFLVVAVFWRYFAKKMQRFHAFFAYTYPVIGVLLIVYGVYHLLQ